MVSQEPVVVTDRWHTGRQREKHPVMNGFSLNERIDREAPGIVRKPLDHGAPGNWAMKYRHRSIPVDMLPPRTIDIDGKPQDRFCHTVCGLCFI